MSLNRESDNHGLKFRIKTKQKKEKEKEKENLNKKKFKVNYDNTYKKVFFLNNGDGKNIIIYKSSFLIYSFFFFTFQITYRGVIIFLRFSDKQK